MESELKSIEFLKIFPKHQVWSRSDNQYILISRYHGKIHYTQPIWQVYKIAFIPPYLHHFKQKIPPVVEFLNCIHLVFQFSFVRRQKIMLNTERRVKYMRVFENHNYSSQTWLFFISIILIEPLSRNKFIIYEILQLLLVEQMHLILIEFFKRLWMLLSFLFLFWRSFQPTHSKIIFFVLLFLKFSLFSLSL